MYFVTKSVTGLEIIFLKKKYIELVIEICNGGVGFLVCLFVCFCYCWVLSVGFFFWEGGLGEFVGTDFIK